MNNGKSSSLEQLLLFDNFQILGTPFKFAEVIHKREGGKWNEAQRKASELIKANAAWNYLEDLRERMSTEEQSQTTIVIQPAQTEVPDTQAEQTAPIKMNQEDIKQKQDEDMFEENYILLTQFAPELEEELQTLTDKSILSGKSAVNQHGSTSLKSIEKDKYGYYLLLEINESAQPQQEILLFVSTTKKIVQVLYSENSNGKFEVYSDIYTREMVNPHQLEIQNNHLTKQLEGLINYKLSIPTIDVVPIEEPKAPESPKETPDQAFQRDLVQYIKYDDDFKRHSNEEYLDRMIEENEELEKENEELKDEIKTTDEFLEKSVFPTLYSQNFKLLQLLISNFTNELRMKSFTAYLEPENPEHPTFKIEFSNVTYNIICDIHEVNPTQKAEDHHCSFVIKDGKNAHFIGCTNRFITLKEEVYLYDDFEVSENSLRGNSALFNFFITLLAYKYRSKISNRVYPIQIVKNKPQKAEEIETLEAVEEPNESDGTGAVVAILSAIGLGILGFKFLKP